MQGSFDCFWWLGKVDKSKVAIMHCCVWIEGVVKTGCTSILYIPIKRIPQKKKNLIKSVHHSSPLIQSSNCIQLNYVYICNF